MFDIETWKAVPFHFWSVVLFVLGSMVGSFLNVCIYRMPRDESIISPPSHCPHCNYSIPWYLNMPLATWLILRGKCANCRAPISVRYFIVELITGLAFLGTWLTFGHQQPLVALAYCILLAGFIAATFIDWEHFIIPDEITIGGIIVGFLCSVVVPALHGRVAAKDGLVDSAWGIVIGGGIVYGVVRLGKILFGRIKMDLPPDTRVYFTEESLVLPDEEIPYTDIYYRKSDYIEFHAKTLELPDRGYREVIVRVTGTKLEIGDEVIDPGTVHHMEAVTDRLILPREAMGLGDVKFMAAIGAFLGWPGVIFSLFFSSVIGAVVGALVLVLRKQDRSAQLPYGPFIAMAATVWIFFSDAIVRLLFNR